MGNFYRGNYYNIPEIGLENGKWSYERRLRGLEKYWLNCKDKTILDLGCAEGMISYKFMENGARLVHGFDYEQKRTDFATNYYNRMFGNCESKTYFFSYVDLNNWDSFMEEYKDILLKEYDIVLFLDIFHHLQPHTRMNIVDKSINLAKHLWICKTPEATMKQVRGFVYNKCSFYKVESTTIRNYLSIISGYKNDKLCNSSS